MVHFLVCLRISPDDFAWSLSHRYYSLVLEVLDCSHWLLYLNHSPAKIKYTHVLITGVLTMTHEWRRGEYLISTDKERLDIATIHGFLTTSYWAAGISIEIVKRSIEH